MDKINKDELMKRLNLTEEKLEKVAGGGIYGMTLEYCIDGCMTGALIEIEGCGSKYVSGSAEYQACIDEYEKWRDDCIDFCNSQYT